MYGRVARFEGLDRARIDDGIAAMKQQMAAARAGTVPEGAPEQLGVLMETVKRFLELVDRESGTSLGIIFCDTEEDLRRADEALNAMSPGEGQGRRTSVETYEVALDEMFR